MLEGIIQIPFRHPHTVLSHGIEMLTDAAMMRDKMARCDAICTAAAGYSAALHPPRGVGVGTPRCRDRRTAAPPALCAERSVVYGTRSKRLMTGSEL